MKIIIIWFSALAVALVNCQHYNIPAQGSATSLNYRLPNETYPEHYDITIRTDVHAGEKGFQGKVLIDIVVQNDTKTIVLHAGHHLKISNVTILNPSTSELEELSHEYEFEREFLKLTRKNKNKFLADTKWRLNITYSGELLRDKNGIGLYKYIDNDGKDHYCAQSSFESTYARRAFPCYDEPNKRTSFTITVHHSENYTALSNSPVNEIMSSKGKTVFLTTPLIPTYEVQIFVSDLVYNEEVLNGIRHRNYYPAGTEFKMNPEANITSMIINYLEEYTGLKYSDRRIQSNFDHKPSFFSGIMQNNWDLVDLKDNTEVFAEKLSHYIFSDYITLQWWTYVWLINGLGTLFRNKALDNIYPEWHIWERFHYVWYENLLKADGPQLTRPLTSYVEKPNEIKEVKYFPITGQRATFVLMMWNKALTEEVFQKGIQNFLKYSQHNAITEDDFFTALQNATEEKNYRLPATIRQMMTTWTQQGGYPLLTITRNYKSGNFGVKQEPYGSDKLLKGNSWYIPINYAAASNPDFSDTKATHYLPNVTETQVDADIPKDDWLLVNKQSTGLYRIKYDEENYRLLTNSLKAEGPFKIPARNRAQLLIDASSLCFSKRLSHSILLNMMTYLKNENDYLPWAEATSIIIKYKQYLADEDNFKWFATKLISPIFKKLSVNNNPLDEHFSAIEGIACSLDVKECLDKAHNNLQAIINGTLVTLDPFVEVDTYCVGLRQSGEKEFDFLYQKLLTTTDTTTRSLLISGLRCSRNESNIMKFLNASIDYSNKLNPADRVRLLTLANKRDKISSLTLIKFLKTNWKVIGNFTGKKSDSLLLSKLIRQISQYVISEDVKEKLLDLVTEVKGSQYAAANLEADVNKNIANNFEWLTEHGQPIMSWIKIYRDQSKNSDSKAT